VPRVRAGRRVQLEASDGGHWVLALSDPICSTFEDNLSGIYHFIHFELAEDAERIAIVYK